LIQILGSVRLARHGLFGHLYLRTIMMVLTRVTTTSFAILQLFSLPSCLHLRATPFSTEGVGACAFSPYSSDTSPDTDSRSGYCTSTRTFSHHARTIVFAVVGHPVRLPGLRPVLRPVHDRRSSMRVRGESIMLMAFVRVCRRGGHGGACHT
jgi:hypothetical protein